MLFEEVANAAADRPLDLLAGHRPSGLGGQVADHQSASTAHDPDRRRRSEHQHELPGPNGSRHPACLIVARSRAPRQVGRGSEARGIGRTGAASDRSGQGSRTRTTDSSDFQVADQGVQPSPVRRERQRRRVAPGGDDPVCDSATGHRESALIVNGARQTDQSDSSSNWRV